MITPWGISQTSYKICDGFYSVSTASHGGYLLSKKLAESVMPESAINNGFLGSQFGNFYAYEEDCAWSAVALSVFELPENHHIRVCYENYLRSEYGSKTVTEFLEIAKATAKRYYPNLVA